MSTVVVHSMRRQNDVYQQERSANREDGVDFEKRVTKDKDWVLRGVSYSHNARLSSLHLISNAFALVSAAHKRVKRDRHVFLPSELTYCNE